MKKHFFHPLLLLVAAFIFFAATRPAVFTYDVLEYGLWIKDPGWYDLQRHVLFHLCVNGFYTLVRLFDSNADAIGTGRVFVGIFAATGIAAMAALLKRLTGSRSIALWGTILLATSAGYWRHAFDLEVMVPAVTFQVLTLLMLFSDEIPGYGRVFASGILAALAGLFHQSQLVFAVIPAFAILGLAPWAREKSWPDRLRLLLVFSFAWLGLCLPVYLAAAAMGDSLGSMGALRKWFFHLASFGYGHWKSHAVTDALSSWVNSWANIVPYVSSMAKGHFSPFKRSIAALLLIAGFAAWLIRGLRAGKTSLEDAGLRILMWGWFAGYLVLFTWWEPGNSEHMVHLMVPAVVLASLLSYRMASIRSGKIIMWSFLFLLFADNWAGTMGPAFRKSANREIKAARQLLEAAKPGKDMVMLSHSPLAKYLQYRFGDDYCFQPDTSVVWISGFTNGVISRVDERIAKIHDSGGKVFLEAGCVNPATYSWLEKRFPGVSAGLLAKHLKTRSDQPDKKMEIPYRWIRLRFSVIRK